jgi:hypothetical protein
MVRRNPWRAFLILAAGLVAGAFVVGLLSSGVRAQVARSTTRQPDRFTELYFTNEQGLPKDLRGQGPFSFQFTIADHEGRSVDYSYLVTAQDAAGTTPITRSAVVVGSGQSAARSVTFMPARTGTTYLVTVQLLGRPETIHFRGIS